MRIIQGELGAWPGMHIESIDPDTKCEGLVFAVRGQSNIDEATMRLNLLTDAGQETNAECYREHPPHSPRIFTARQTPGGWYWTPAPGMIGDHPCIMVYVDEVPERILKLQLEGIAMSNEDFGMDDKGNRK